MAIAFDCFVAVPIARFIPDSNQHKLLLKTVKAAHCTLGVIMSRHAADQNERLIHVFRGPPLLGIIQMKLSAVQGADWGKAGFSAGRSRAIEDLQRDTQNPYVRDGVIVLAPREGQEPSEYWLRQYDLMMPYWEKFVGVLKEKEDVSTVSLKHIEMSLPVLERLLPSMQNMTWICRTGRHRVSIYRYSPFVFLSS